MKVVYLYPKSPVKTLLASDTLYGIICWGYRMLFSEDNLQRDLLSPCKINSPPFLLSSAFPFIYNNSTKTHYFPKPVLPPPKIASPDMEVRQRIKKFRKLVFLPEDLFFSYIAGKLCSEEVYERCCNLVIQSIVSDETPHNVIDRSTTTTNEGGLFSTEYFFFREDAGLFFLLKAEPDIESRIIAVLGFLRDHGFGGDASIGKGCFDVSVDQCRWPVFDGKAGRFLTLSSYHPTVEERALFKQYPDKVWYHLESRKGKVGGGFIHPKDFWKMTTLFFATGSTFPECNRQIYGMNPIVKKYPFEVQSYGFAFPVPLHIKEQ